MNVIKKDFTFSDTWNFFTQNVARIIIGSTIIFFVAFSLDALTYFRMPTSLLTAYQESSLDEGFVFLLELRNIILFHLFLSLTLCFLPGPIKLRKVVQLFFWNILLKPFLYGASGLVAALSGIISYFLFFDLTFANTVLTKSILFTWIISHLLLSLRNVIYYTQEVSFKESLYQSIELIQGKMLKFYIVSIVIILIGIIAPLIFMKILVPNWKVYSFVSHYLLGSVIGTFCQYSIYQQMTQSSNNDNHA